MDHIVLLSGAGSSVPFLRCRFRAWAKKLAARIPQYRPETGVIVHELSSDGDGEKSAIVQILREEMEGRLRRVILCGHSNGARDVLFMAETFYNANIVVDYVACLDMTLAEWGAKAFGNIMFLDEFHAQLQTVDFDKSFIKTPHNYRKWEVMGGHVGMASSETVQNRLVEKITEVLG